MGKSKIGTGTLNLRSLPLHKAAAGNAFLKGRLAVPQNIRPKLTLTHAPGLKFRPRFSPFVQRYWKKAFFWVAVAGIGYLTIPELYYNSFYSCVSVDDPIWDDCSYILSYAAIEEEEVVRVSMPATAKYRYTAKAPAPPADCPSCRWDRFVERKWNQSFAWVKLPQVGNITVPDAYYDRFYTYAGANPPNYPQACQVLDGRGRGHGGERCGADQHARGHRLPLRGRGGADAGVQVLHARSRSWSASGTRNTCGCRCRRPATSRCPRTPTTASTAMPAPSRRTIRQPARCWWKPPRPTR